MLSERERQVLHGINQVSALFVAMGEQWAKGNTRDREIVCRSMRSVVQRMNALYGEACYLTGLYDERGQWTTSKPMGESQ
jgi:hypothetical protein